MSNTEMSNTVTINDDLIARVMNAYLELGGSYYGDEDVEWYVNDVLDSEVDYDNLDHLIEIVAEHMMFAE